jgi:glutamate/tyrosine decarboxylase-like PLP-dependent enzyme
MALRSAINDNTVMIAASAPCLPFGVVDPIREVGKIAQEHGINLHVDGSLGGVQLPYYRMLGHDVPEFDFSVPGVTSMSTELHKFGFAPPGVSVILHRTEEQFKFQQWELKEWKMGTYRNRNLLGTHAGAPTAAAWAIMRFLGTEGFMRAAGRQWNAMHRIFDGVAAMQDLYIVGKPDVCTFAIGARKGDITVVMDALRAKGWFPSPRIQTDPSAIHITLSPMHEDHVDEFLADLQVASKASLA